MAVYKCIMRTAYTVNIEADSEIEALDWVQTHDFDDIRKLTVDFDIAYEDEVIGEINEEAAIKIT